MHDGEENRWHYFPAEKPKSGERCQISLLRPGLKEIRMYAVWNGDEWFTEQALPLPIDQFCLAYRRWIKDYEE